MLCCNYRALKGRRAWQVHKVKLDLRERRDLKVTLVIKETWDLRVSLGYKVHLVHL